MYIKIKNKNISLIEANTFWERFKGLKFVLGPLKYGVRFPNKKSSNTYFLFERVDVILTDKDEKILYILKNVGTEKHIWKKKNVYNTYFLPVGVGAMFNPGDILKVVVEKDDEIRRMQLSNKKIKKKKKGND